MSSRPRLAASAMHDRERRREASARADPVARTPGTIRTCWLCTPTCFSVSCTSRRCTEHNLDLCSLLAPTGRLSRDDHAAYRLHCDAPRARVALLCARDRCVAAALAIALLRHLPSRRQRRSPRPSTGVHVGLRRAAPPAGPRARLIYRLARPAAAGACRCRSIPRPGRDPHIPVRRPAEATCVLIAQQIRGALDELAAADTRAHREHRPGGRHPRATCGRFLARCRSRAVSSI